MSIIRKKIGVEGQMSDTNIREYLVELNHELNNLGQTVEYILISKPWHEALNKQTREPMNSVDRFYGKKYCVLPDISSPYYLLIRPKLNQSREGY